MEGEMDDESTREVWQWWSMSARQWFEAAGPGEHRRQRRVLQKWSIRLGQWVTSRVLEERNRLRLRQE